MEVVACCTRLDVSIQTVSRNATEDGNVMLNDMQVKLLRGPRR